MIPYKGVISLRSDVTPPSHVRSTWQAMSHMYKVTLHKHFVFTNHCFLLMSDASPGIDSSCFSK